MTEKRQHERKAYKKSVDVCAEGNKHHQGESLDISLGGVFVCVEPYLPIAANVEVSIELPGLGEVKMPGFVRWKTEEGFGIQWGLLGPRETHAIGKIVRGSLPDLSE